MCRISRCFQPSFLCRLSDVVVSYVSRCL
ncbi:hypothetical protein CSUI_006468, partial [Cystoisospora suis]